MPPLFITPIFGIRPPIIVASIEKVVISPESECMSSKFKDRNDGCHDSRSNDACTSGFMLAFAANRLT